MVKETGSDLKMSPQNSRRIGFKDRETPGSAYAAIFELERRFFVNGGMPNGVNWEGASLSGKAHSARMRLSIVSFSPVKTTTRQTMQIRHTSPPFSA